MTAANGSFGAHFSRVANKLNSGVLKRQARVRSLVQPI
jgi:hypothetical protein